METNYILLIAFMNMLLCNGEKCVYQMDMESNKVKIVCGHGAVLNIIDQHGNSILSGETGKRREAPIVVQLNRSSLAKLNDKSKLASKKLTDASRLMKKSREDFITQMKDLVNLTSTLQQGDTDLNSDLERLRRHDLTSPLVREAIIAALQNQYNFLRMAVLSQNSQLKDLIKAMMRLTTSIMKTARGARGVGEILDLRTDAINNTLYKITKLMPGGFEKGAFFGETTVLCPQGLKSISPIGSTMVAGVEQGTLMRDPFSSEVWVTYGFNNINEITQYNSLKSLKFEFVAKTYELPFSCVGTGHVVYKKVLYCQKMYANKIVSYNLAKSRWLGEKQLDNVGVANTYPYQSKKHSDIDFAVDETGLWLIYATNSSKGNIVVSKMTESDLSFEKTWVTNIPKKDVGNAFIICGVLYAVDSYENIPTYVRYTFDTNTGVFKELESSVLPFQNSLGGGDFARVYSLDYSPDDRALFSWNNGRVEIFPVSFSSASYEP